MIEENDSQKAWQQLTLNLGLKPKRDFDGFVAGENAQLVANLIDLPAKKARHFYFIWGEKGCGKSHLLQAECQLATQSQLQCIYLEANGLPPDKLEYRETITLAAELA